MPYSPKTYLETPASNYLKLNLWITGWEKSGHVTFLLLFYSNLWYRSGDLSGWKVTFCLVCGG